MRVSDGGDSTDHIRDPGPVVNEGLSPSGGPAQAGIKTEGKVNAQKPSATIRRAFLLPWHWLLDYPRASISAILTVVSGVAGLLLLPSHRVILDADRPDISLVSLKTTPRVPAYLGFIVRSDRVGEIVLGFEIPKRETVHWKVFLTVNNRRDQLAWRNGTAKKFNSLPAGDAYLYGNLAGPSTIYRQLQHGYWSFSDNLGIFSLTMRGKPVQKLVSVFVRTSGPDQFLRSSGYNVTATLPTLLETPPSASERLISEDMVHMPGFENITGGPRIVNGKWWDWLGAGVLPESSATGVDDVARQKYDNRTFDAAVAFGVGAASFAAFLVEGIGAVSESRKKRSNNAGLAGAQSS